MHLCMKSEAVGANPAKTPISVPLINYVSILLGKNGCKSYELLDCIIFHRPNCWCYQARLCVCLCVCLTGRPCGTRLGPGGPDSSKSSSQAKKPILRRNFFQNANGIIPGYNEEKYHVKRFSHPSHGQNPTFLVQIWILWLFKSCAQTGHGLHEVELDSQILRVKVGHWQRCSAFMPCPQWWFEQNCQIRTLTALLCIYALPIVRLPSV